MFRWAASSSWILALSASMTRNRSRVGGVQKTGPANPWRTSVGMLPQWSMWAWLRTTASIWCGWNGKWALRCRASSRRPWCSPQSSRTLWLPTSSRCIDPETLPAAPQKVRVGSGGGAGGEVGVGFIRVFYPDGRSELQRLRPRERDDEDLAVADAAGAGGAGDPVGQFAGPV